MKRIFFVLILSLAGVLLAQSPFQPGGLIVPKKAAAGAPACDTIISTNSGTLDSNLGQLATTSGRQYVWWQITNTLEGTVCALDLSIYKTGTPNWNMSIGIYTTTDNTNPAVQLGGDSDVIATSTLGTSATTNTFTWSANYPVIVGNSNHVMVLKSSNFGNGGNCLLLPVHNPFKTGVLTIGNASWVPNQAGNRRPYFRLKSQ